MTPLSLLPKGTRAKIIQIDAGRGLEGRLKHMGLYQGEVIKVVQNTEGPVVVAKGGMRLALGRGMSQKVLVEEI